MSALQQVVEATLREATPLLFATMGGVISERSGVINLALEGYLLAGAFGGAAGILMGGGVLGGAALGVASAVVVAAVHGAICTKTRADHVVAGVAINLVVAALTIAALVSLFAQKGSSPPFPGEVSDAISSARVTVPLLGKQSWLTWLALAMVPLVMWGLSRTTPGLRLRAVGENPECAESLGVSAFKVRFLAVCAAGFVTGLGGLYLVFEAGRFAKNMSAGRGFLALAAVVIGKWHPRWAAAAVIAFSALRAIANRFQGQAPDEFLTMLPYLATLIALSGFVGRARPPAALGRPLENG